MKNFRPLTLAIAGACLLGGAFAVHSLGTLEAQEADQIPKTREDIETIVREYILENPEIIFEAADRYSAQQSEVMAEKAKDVVRENLATLVSGSPGFAIGATPEDADVLVVEFFDYHCGYCRRATDFVFELSEKDQDLRLVFLELPIVHENSRDVSIAALAAPNAKAYTKLHRALMGHSGLIEAKDVPKIAKRAGIDFRPFEANLDSATVRASIEAKIETATEIAFSIGIDGTPGFIIVSPDGENVRVISGFDEDAVTDAIKSVRAASNQG